MDSAEIDLKELVAILKRQGRLIATTLAFTLGLGIIYILSTTPIYRATALLMVDSRGNNLLDPSATDIQQSAILNSLVDSEAEILRSQATALAVVDAGNLLQDQDFGPQIGWLEKAGIALGVNGNEIRRMVGLSPKARPDDDNLVQQTIQRVMDAVNVRRQGLTYLIAVSASSPDPQKAAYLANLYSTTYIQKQVESKISDLLASRDILRSQLAEAQAQLINAETAVNNYIENNLAQLELESGNPVIGDLRRRLESTKAESSRLHAQVLATETAIETGNWGDTLTALDNAAMTHLAEQRSALEKRLAGTTAGSQEAVDLSSALDELKQQMLTESQSHFADLRSQISNQSDLESSARNELREVLLQSGMSAEMLTSLFNLQQTANNARTKYQTILSREQDMTTMANLQVADARVVSNALPPPGPSAPRKGLILFASIICGLMIGTVLGFLREYYIGGISSANQLSNVIGAKVPVSIGEIERREATDLSETIITAPMSPYAESFRKLRVSIDMACDPQNFNRGRVILITSALQAEGKSTSAVSLARTYAEAGLRTLLIDSDLRKPAVATRLGLESTVGLLDYLTSWGKEESLDLQVMRDPKSTLMVVTAGRRSSTPTDQLINSQAYRALIDETCNHFDVVIIDSPPLLPVVDTRYLARYADAIVQIVRFSTTSQQEAREAAGQLAEMKGADVPFFGVLSHEKRSGPIYGRYYNYSYYGDDES